MEKIFIYCRVSTDLQGKKNTQINQKTAIMNFLNNLDVQIIDEFQDLGISGANKNREQFNLMLSRLNEISAIAVFDLDRLARDMEIGLELMRILMQKRIKIYEARTKTVKDLLNDNDQLLYFIGMWYSANERKKIHARQKLGIERYKLEKGRWGRRKKTLNLKKYQDLREMGIPKTVIAKIMSIHVQTLYARLHELGVEL